MKRTKRFEAMRYGLLLLFSLWAVAPILYMARVGLSLPINVPNGTPKWLGPITVVNLQQVVTDKSFLTALGVSLLVAFASTVVVLLIATPAAYICGVLEFRGRRDLEFWILTTRMLPPVVVLVPYFVLFRNLSLLDTPWVLIIMHATMNLGLAFFMLRSFFVDIPAELMEAASLDGCTDWSTFTLVALPLTRNGLVATGILSFIFSWNELVFALTLAGGATKTGPVGIFNFISFQSIAVAPLMAASIVLIAPIALLLVVVQKALVRGLTLGAVKG